MDIFNIVFDEFKGGYRFSDNLYLQIGEFIGVETYPGQHSIPIMVAPAPGGAYYSLGAMEIGNGNVVLRLMTVRYTFTRRAAGVNGAYEEFTFPLVDPNSEHKMWIMLERAARIHLHLGDLAHKRAWRHHARRFRCAYNEISASAKPSWRK